MGPASISKSRLLQCGEHWKFMYHVVVVVVVDYPTPSQDGGMAEDHGAPEAGQLSRVWTRGRTETESRQRVSGAESVAGQCRMR